MTCPPPRSNRTERAGSGPPLRERERERDREIQRDREREREREIETQKKRERERAPSLPVPKARERERERGRYSSLPSLCAPKIVRPARRPLLFIYTAWAPCKAPHRERFIIGGGGK